ncbi:MAG: hypothetical protein ACI4XE_07070 [Acutalibacteraceae bacterium]
MDTNEIITKACQKINASENLPVEVTACVAYDTICDPIPIDRYYVVLNGHESESQLFENDNYECCQKTEIVIKMNCYAPLDENNAKINELALKLSDILLGYFEGKMTGFKIGSVYVDDSLKVFCLPCKLFFSYEQCPASVSADSVLRPFADFMCKTHVNDTTSHLTEEEKNYLGEPFVIGDYTGLGDGNHQVINLGFYPKFVLVFAPSTALLSMSGENPVIYLAVAARGLASKGIVLQKVGFKVAQSETYSSYGVYPKLNELDRSYAYIAFK